MTTKFSPYLRSFRKNHNAQYSLLNMKEIYKKHLDKEDKIRVIMTDLSMAFGTIIQSLHLSKLDV